MVNIASFLLAFLFMEFVAWWSHKYVMHGFLWKWHKDHHRRDHQQGLPLNTEDKYFEKNDRFFLIYALPAIVIMMLGLSLHYFILIWISAGITTYGLTYFIIHDVIIHDRLKTLFKIKRHNFYIQAVVRAHTAHHKPKSRKDFNNYGLLVFPFRFFKEQ